jgi:hypothetical protein
MLAPRTSLFYLTSLLVADVLQDKSKYKALLAYRGDEAQQVLDCLQVVSFISRSFLVLDI